MSELRIRPVHAQNTAKHSGAGTPADYVVVVCRPKRGADHSREAPW